ncbi:MAG: hypothetical protein KIT19_12805 [Phycisphaeraceae bacterium]|nr:hypothetical protein [Phycisphaeraceae bacterium]
MSIARWIVGGTMVAGALAIAVCAKRLSLALESAERASGTLVEAEAHASSIRAARRETPWFGATAPIEPDLSGRVVRALGIAGIDPARLKSVRQTRDAAVASDTGNTVRRRTVSVSIDGVTIGEISAFLDHWERDASEWTIARAEVQRHATAGGTGALRVELVRTYASVGGNGRKVSRARGG